MAARAQSNEERVGSLEEELRDKIRDSHELQIAARAQRREIAEMGQRGKEQAQRILELQRTQRESERAMAQLSDEHRKGEQRRSGLQTKLNEAVRDNADSVMRTERQIASIEGYHLKKYKLLLASFERIKERMAMQRGSHRATTTKLQSSSVGYDNSGWKRSAQGQSGHGHGAEMEMPMEMDGVSEETDERMREVAESITDLTTPATLVSVRRLQRELKESRERVMRLSRQAEQHTKEKGKGKVQQTKKEKKEKSSSRRVNVDYLRNVLVKFLMLTECFTEEQVTLVPVVSSILRLNRKEKAMIDDAYNANSYFLGRNTLFPESANAHSKKRTRTNHT